MRLIDADALIEEALTGGVYCYVDALQIAIAPTVDVVPVVHGRWIEKKKYIFGTMYDCSICGNRILNNGHAWNYCPNCGAKMDLEALQ